MTLYRRLPAVVQAFRWGGEETPVGRRLNVGKDELGGDHYCLEVFGPDGVSYASPGDWLVTDEDDGWQVVGAEHFERCYEPVDGAGA